jgi:hypothetical protein
MFRDLVNSNGKSGDELLEGQIRASEIVVGDGLSHVLVAYLEELA